MEKKILFFCTFPPPYTGQTIGTELVYDQLSNVYRTDKINISLSERHQKKGGSFSLSYTIHFLKKFWELKSQISKGDYDYLYIVLSSSLLGHLRDLLIMFFLSKSDVKIVAHSRTGNLDNVFDSYFYKLFSKYYFEKIDRLIVLSKGLKERISGHFINDKIVVLNNPIDKKIRFTEEEIENKLNERKKRSDIQIVFISNNFPEKGYFDLGKSLTKLPDKLNFEAHFVGSWNSDEQRDRFVDFLKINTVYQKVQIHGLVKDRSWIKKLLQKADIFVLPTYYEHEAQPRSIIEAMNAATPIIATSHAAIPEYVFHNYNGYLVKKRSPDDIKDSILKLTIHDDWIEKARNARKTYLDFFSEKKQRVKLIKIFRNISIILFCFV
jgi:glycosyltransferase involved in cell wall biosynthesis